MWGGVSQVLVSYPHAFAFIGQNAGQHEKVEFLLSNWVSILFCTLPPPAQEIPGDLEVESVEGRI